MVSDVFQMVRRDASGGSLQKGSDMNSYNDEKKENRVCVLGSNKKLL
jgi:hypothetical protein